MAEMGRCEICEQPSTKKCAKCSKVFYCSREHQVEGWTNHQRVCRPFMICSNEELGRYLVATKPIKEGDVILQEWPLISGPLEENTLVCLGCLNSLPCTNEYFYCKKCGWPFCGEKCANNPDHAPECYYIVKSWKKFSAAALEKFRPYVVFISLLRCLYQKKHDPEVWKKINELESHGNNTSEFLRSCDKDSVYVVHDIFHLNEFNKEEIRKVWRILNINNHGVPISTPSHIKLYEIASLFEHNCKSNCYKAFNSKGMLRVIAGTPIKEGDHLSICYIFPDLPTFIRQKKLQEERLFKCLCDRCTDVTEFGTYFSSAKCPKMNCEGVLLPATFLDKGLKWTCNKCKFEMAADDAIDTIPSLEFITEKVKIADGSTFTKFLMEQQNILPNNSMGMFHVRRKLIYKIADATEIDLLLVSSENLELKITLCDQILKLMEKIMPAEKRVSAIFMDHLQMSLRELYRRETNQSTKCHLPILEKCKSLLKQIVESYRYDFCSRKNRRAAKGQLETIEKKILEIIYK